MSNQNNSRISEIEKEKLLYESYNNEKRMHEREEDAKRSKTPFQNKIRSEEVHKIIEYEEFKNYIVKRELLTNNIYKPFFEAFNNTYTRVSFPNGYAICRIINNVYDNEYSFPFGNFKYTTDKYLIVKHGDNKLKVPVTHISNAEIIKEEYEAIKRHLESEDKIVSEYKRLVKLLDRKLTEEEQKKEKEEKNKFMHGVGKRRSFYKMDILRKRKKAVNDRNRSLVKEIDEAIEKLNENNNEIKSIELNEIGRKFDLKITGSEVVLPKMETRKDYSRKK